MRIITRCAMAAVAASAALAVSGAPAHAATGELILQGPDGTTVIENPPAGCIARTPVITRITNDTDSYVFVYDNFDCDGVGIAVGPGITFPVGDGVSILVQS